LEKIGTGSVKGVAWEGLPLWKSAGKRGVWGGTGVVKGKPCEGLCGELGSARLEAKKHQHSRGSQEILGGQRGSSANEVGLLRGEGAPGRHRRKAGRGRGKENGGAGKREEAIRMPGGGEDEKKRHREKKWAEEQNRGSQHAASKGASATLSLRIMRVSIQWEDERFVGLERGEPGKARTREP